MALATRCPNCQSMFRVVSDQLKLRGGLVRCGSCRHVFDAISSLSYIDETAAGASGAPAARSPAHGAAGASRGASMPAAPVGRERAAEPAPEAARPAVERPRARTEAAARSAEAAAEPAAGERQDALAVPTLFAPNLPELEQAVDAESEAVAVDLRTARAERGDAIARATRIEAEAPHAAGQRPTVGTGAEAQADEDATADAPEFLRSERGARGFSVVFGGGSVLLALLLALQSVVAFRTELLTRWPELRPQIVHLCAVFGCNVGWPTRAELLAVIGTELQAVPGTDILELTTVIRNRAAYKVALPAVEVTLTDTLNRALARKVFAPADYLASGGEPSSRIDEGLGAGSDLVVRVVFEARGLNASGFVVYPFYL